MPAKDFDLSRKQQLPPQALEPMPGNTGVVGDVLGTTVPEVVLPGAQAGALVGKAIATRVAQHVRAEVTEHRLFAGNTGDVVHSRGFAACQR
jgi:hypothetical protein